MLKTLIVEDEHYIRKGLITMINSLEKDMVILGECESVKEAVVVSKATKPDLVLLDINLTDGNAFDFLEQVPDLDFKVIFITAYEQYALKAIKNGAVDYILKPVDIDELEEAIDKAVSLNAATQKKQLEVVKNQLVDNKKDKIVLRLQEGYQIISLDKLVYCSSDKGYTTFYLNDGNSYIASKPIKDFEEQLPYKTFFRTHQSFIVNMNYINKYDKTGYIYLKTGPKVPVSSRKKEAFVKRLLK